MDNGIKISLDMFLTLLRYSIITYCVNNGITGDSQTALVNLGIAGATVLWGLYSSGYWARFRTWLSKLSETE